MDSSNDIVGKDQRAVQSVEVGGRLLLALAAHSAPMTLKDLAARAQLPGSRAHPYLVSYGRLGLVLQDSVTGLYALGPAALQIGLTALHQCDPVRIAGPMAEQLANSTGQAVAMAVWGNFGPTVVRMIDARQPLHVAMRTGTVMSPFGTATGRAFAAVLRPERITELMAATALGGSRQKTNMTTISEYLDQIADAKAEFAQRGCTRAVGRPIPGVNAFSTPVFDHDGQASLVLTVLGHQDHVASSWSSPIAVAVQQAAAEVSLKLGYKGRLAADF
jgi:DNA-binding IclR family transcriptional regulator